MNQNRRPSLTALLSTMILLLLLGVLAFGLAVVFNLNSIAVALIMAVLIGCASGVYAGITIRRKR
jgi:preprotein translocase subunit SecF